MKPNSTGLFIAPLRQIMQKITVITAVKRVSSRMRLGQKQNPLLHMHHHAHHGEKCKRMQPVQFWWKTSKMENHRTSCEALFPPHMGFMTLPSSGTPWLLFNFNYPLMCRFKAAFICLLKTVYNCEYLCCTKRSQNILESKGYFLELTLS